FACAGRRGGGPPSWFGGWGIALKRRVSVVKSRPWAPAITAAHRCTMSWSSGSTRCCALIGEEARNRLPNPPAAAEKGRSRAGGNAHLAKRNQSISDLWVCLAAARLGRAAGRLPAPASAPPLSH